MVQITTPVLRLLQGSAFIPETKDMQGNPMTVKTGPNAGQPTQQFVLVGGIAKNDPAALPFLMQLCEVARAEKPLLWPNGVTAPPANFAPQYVQQVAQLFGCTHPQYALKIQDGDGFDGNGQPNSRKEGHAGHWIIKFSQPSAIRVYEAGKYQELERVDIDPAKHSLLKTGYYIRVGAQVNGNGNDQRPGLYMNPAMVEIVRAGVEIVSGPDASAVFGGAPVAAAPLPAVPSPAPVASTPAAYTAPPATPSPSNPAPAPYTGFIPAAPVPPTPPVPAAPPARVMLPAAQGATYEAMIAAGWTDEMLRTHGMMQ